MPRANNLAPSQTLGKILMLGDPKAGKSDWAARAAEAGFNVLYFDGDVAGQTIAQLSDEAKSRIYYMDVSDQLVGDKDPRFIDTLTGFTTSTRYIWNDTKQKEFSIKDGVNEEGFALDEIWEFRPSKLDHYWVFVLDSWTNLAMSGMLAKANDSGVDLADIEKAERSMYQGTGNRLTQIAATLQKFPCHVITIGHPDQYEKRRSQDGKTVKEAMKETDQIVEWTKMVPKSSSRPHSLTLGKFFSDVGWIDVGKYGKRELDFTATSARVSGGHLNSKGDPRESHSFANVVKSMGGFIPDGTQDTGEALTIHPPGTYLAKKPAQVLGAKPASSSTTPAAQPSTVKGLGGLVGLKSR